MARRFILLLGMFITTYFIAVINSSEPLFRYSHRSISFNRHISVGEQYVKLVVLSKPPAIKKQADRTRIWAKFADAFEPAKEYALLHISFSAKLKIIARNSSFVKKAIHYSDLRGPPALSGTIS
jgi:hypothetical protein